MAVIATILDTSYEAGQAWNVNGMTSGPGSQAGYSYSLRPGIGGDNPGDIEYGSSVYPPARDGQRSMRFLVREGDEPPFQSTLRAEISNGDSGDTTNVGDICWYGFSIWIPSNCDQIRDTTGLTWGDPTSWRIIRQWHGGSGSPVWSIHNGYGTVNHPKLFVARRVNGTAEAVRYSVAGLNQTGSISAMPDADPYMDQWLDFVVQMRWANDSSGIFRMWMNGNLIVDFSGNTLDGETNPYTKLGLYGHRGGLVYQDATKIIKVNDLADYYDDVVPGGGVAQPERTITGGKINLQISSASPPILGQWRNTHVYNTDTVTIPAPTDSALGDRNLVVMRFNTDIEDVTPPSGMTPDWHKFPDTVTPGAEKVVAFLCDPLTAVGDMTFTLSSVVGLTRISRATIKGGGLITPGDWGNAPASGSSTDITAPSMTNPVNGSRILNIWSFDDPTASFTPPAGVTKVNSYHEGFSTTMVFGLTDGVEAAGATSDYTATMADAFDSADRRSMQIAFSPTPSGAPAARTITGGKINVSGRHFRTVTDGWINLQETSERTVSGGKINLELAGTLERTMTDGKINLSVSGIERTITGGKINTAVPITVPVYPRAGWANRR